MKPIWIGLTVFSLCGTVYAQDATDSPILPAAAATSGDSAPLRQWALADRPYYDPLIADPRAVQYTPVGQRDSCLATQQRVIARQDLQSIPLRLPIVQQQTNDSRQRPGARKGRHRRDRAGRNQGFLSRVLARNRILRRTRSSRGRSH